MRRSKIFSTGEVRAMQSGSMTGFYELVNPQPQGGWDMVKKESEKGIFWEERKGHLYMLPWIKSPYELNEPIYVREVWCEFVKEHIQAKTDPRFAYKANSTPDGEEHRIQYAKAGYPYHWQSPATMPREAARLWITPTDCKVMRVQEMEVVDYLHIIDYIIQDITSNTIWKNYSDKCSWFDNSKDSFISNFIAKHGKALWDSTPFIFFYTFKVTEK